jgi:hypothetical protein
MPHINPNIGKFVMRHLKTVTTTQVELISSDQSASSTKAYQEKLAWKDYEYTKIDFSECKLGTANVPFLDPNN